MYPVVTIGIPTFNSEAYLGLTIEGLLAQTFADFELVISDNASTDGTREIVEHYMSLDKRIRYVRQPENIGANLNYSHVVNLANGMFFKWSSSSDWCAPTFLEQCYKELAAHDDTVVVAPRTRLFKNEPSNFEDYQFDLDVLDDSPSARLKKFLSCLRLNNAMNGLIRLSTLRRTRLVEQYGGSDLVLMGHLAMLGKFRLIDDRLFYRRMEVATTTVLQDANEILKFFYPRTNSQALFQGSRRHLGWIRSALSAPMTVNERISALALILKGLYWEKYVIGEDLRLALKFALRGKIDE